MRLYSAKETYIFKKPTHHRHPIHETPQLSRLPNLGRQLPNNIAPEPNFKVDLDGSYPPSHFLDPLSPDMTSFSDFWRQFLSRLKSLSFLSKFFSWCLPRVLFIRDDVKLAQVVWARDCQSSGRRFDSGKNSKNWKPKSTWIWGT